MRLQSPTYTFTLPSIHDGTQLDCRLYLPRPLENPRSGRGAIVAHPYAPLGGCYDDPVVNFIGGELLRAGYVVGTFNFRYVRSCGAACIDMADGISGAGDSGSRTSWTAKPELADYVSFYAFLLYFLQVLALGPGEREGEHGKVSGMDEAEEPSQNTEIVLGGYSYGSLVASHLPGVDTIVNLLRDATGNTAVRAIRTTAKSVAARSNGKRQPEMQPSAQSNPNSVLDDDSLANLSTPSISYLLVSPLLPPLSGFLTIFSKLSLEAAAEVSAEGKRVPCAKPADQLCRHRTLTIYGNQDGFTSAKRLRKWAEELSGTSQGMFQAREIDGAGHFWREDGVETEARNSLRTWLAEMR